MAGLQYPYSGVSANAEPSGLNGNAQTKKQAAPALYTEEKKWSIFSLLSEPFRVAVQNSESRTQKLFSCSRDLRLRFITVVLRTE